MSQTQRAINELGGCPEVRARATVVGAWIWVTFPAPPSEEARAFLKSHGYRFNAKRQAWQNPCGRHSGGAKGYDPRTKYGAVAVAQLEEVT